MESRGNELVIEGKVVLGEGGYPILVDGDALGGFVLAHFDRPLEGVFYRLGRVRITPWPSKGEG